MVSAVKGRGGEKERSDSDGDSQTSCGDMDAEQAAQTWLPFPPSSFIPTGTLSPLTGPELERARSRSATVIQMFWRRHSACRLVADMRRQREEERVAALEAQRQKAAVEMQVRP